MSDIAKAIGAYMATIGRRGGLARNPNKGFGHRKAMEAATRSAERTDRAAEAMREAVMMADRKRRAT
jgi:hypothetical protein